MRNISRAVVPIILVLFVSTYVISPVWANNNEKDKTGDVELSMTIYSYDLQAHRAAEKREKPFAGETIMLDLKVQGKGSQITRVDMLANSFTYIDSFDEQDASPWVHRKAFILSAPPNAGRYPCTFECADKEGNSGSVSTSIDIVAYQKPPDPPPTYEIIVPGRLFPVTSEAKPKLKPVYHTTHMYLGCEWGMFWVGFVIGVVLTAVIYSSGSSRAVK